MKFRFLSLLALVVFCGGAAHAEGLQETRIEQTVKSRLSPHDLNRPYDQLLTIQAGPYSPRAISFTNWNNNSFDFSDQSRNTFLAELGWGMRMFTAGATSFSFSESLAYSSMSLNVPTGKLSGAANPKVTFQMFGFDTRLVHAWDSFPLPELVPFWEGGFQVTLYNQAGSSDLVAGEGSATNLAAAVGLRYWVNRDAALNREFPGRYSALPVFVTAKLNKVFPNNAGFDAACTTVMGGLSVGL